MPLLGLLSTAAVFARRNTFLICSHIESCFGKGRADIDGVFRSLVARRDHPASLSALSVVGLTHVVAAKPLHTFARHAFVARSDRDVTGKHKKSGLEPLFLVSSKQWIQATRRCSLP